MARKIQTGTQLKVQRTSGRIQSAIVKAVTDQNTITAQVGKDATFSATRSSSTTTRGNNFKEGASKGSMLFAGTSSSNLSIANSADFRFGTGDFTIEWWQYQTDTNSAPRIFAMGTYPSQSIGVSLEGGSFYLWVSGANNMGTTPTKNAWHHVAISRSGTSLKLFVDGTQKGSTLTNSTNFADASNLLRIGNETSATTNAAFGGKITNFHWVKGTAKYTANFTPSTSPLTAVANSKLLLLASTSSALVTDSSGTSKTVTNNSVTWDSASPF
jgi:hypothetical protein